MVKSIGCSRLLLREKREEIGLVSSRAERIKTQSKHRRENIVKSRNKRTIGESIIDNRA